MTQGLFRSHPSRIRLGGLLMVAIACCAASPAMARTYTPVDTSACSAPSLSQALLPFGDSNWYTPLPGESNDAMSATGWTLSGGASIKTTTLADGKIGPVLDLPSGRRRSVRRSASTVPTRPPARRCGTSSVARVCSFRCPMQARSPGTSPRPLDRSTANRRAGRCLTQSMSSRATCRAGSSSGSPSCRGANRATFRSTTSS